MKTLFKIGGIIAVAVALFGVVGCGVPPTEDTSPPVSASGVQKATVKVETGADGLTIEQSNIKKRLEQDNKPGSIKHLYVISPFSGQCILYSTVKGKVTSSAKRLTPSNVETSYQTAGSDATSYVSGYGGFPINIGGANRITSEVLGDDGTYGESGSYVYWFDVRGKYYQFYKGSCEIIVSSTPIPVKSVTINIEAQN